MAENEQDNTTTEDEVIDIKAERSKRIEEIFMEMETLFDTVEFVSFELRREMKTIEANYDGLRSLVYELKTLGNNTN